MEIKPDRAIIKQNLNRVREEIQSIARTCGRNPDEITLIGVSKYFPAAFASTAYQLGLMDLGENRVQELNEKIDLLHADGLHPNWHLIGTLQTNKVKSIIGRTALIHSVDSDRLLMEISKRSQIAGVVTDLLLQVNISGEQSKHGFEPEEIRFNIKNWSCLPGLRLRGLMTMAPLDADEVRISRIFSQAKQLQRELSLDCLHDAKFDCLSMGMSQDFRVAIACGATHIRIGTAIFGSRQKPVV